MFFSSLEQTLAQITNQPGWEKYQQYRQLLECWQKIVSKEIGQQTRPLYINRQVLFVATSSSVWSQELTLQRYTLLKQLNTRLAFSLKDIRFSSSQWQQNSDRHLSPNKQDRHSLHPSHIDINTDRIDTNNLPLVDEPQAVVKHWLNVLRERSSNLSVCPQCHSPTPEGELKRWSLCCHCAAKKWSENYHSAVRNNSTKRNFENR